MSQMSQPMPSIRIDTGEIRLAINDDPTRIIKFNPTDALFADRFYKLRTEFVEVMTKHMNHIEELTEIAVVDEHGQPSNAKEQVDAVIEAVKYARERIDEIFGEGTSQTAFEDTYSLEVIIQFFAGVAPYIKDARTSQVNKYVTTKPAKSATKAKRTRRSK